VNLFGQILQCFEILDVAMWLA